MNCCKLLNDELKILNLKNYEFKEMGADMEKLKEFMSLLCEQLEHPKNKNRKLKTKRKIFKKVLIKYDAYLFVRIFNYLTYNDEEKETTAHYIYKESFKKFIIFLKDLLKLTNKDFIIIDIID
jgi:mRNA-degrading endonuclease YafQ of YafQ-DinJ toxin-antitoxin module